ncbi:MAG: LamB/YcsF family protein [Vicingaceae bacterium]
MDINADLGEGAGNDKQIMPLITSCNIACGGHYGDENSIGSTLRLARKNQVRVGAHLSFPDRLNFGRKKLNLSAKELASSLHSQLSIFLQLCREEKLKLHHIKTHGALYNYGANEPKYVNVLIELLSQLPNPPIIYLQQNTLLHQQAKELFPVKKEAFIDRRYIDGTTLVSRNASNALITDPKEAWDQFYLLYNNHQIIGIDGKERTLSADTFCVHGDHPASVKILKYIHQQLHKNGISLK